MKRDLTKTQFEYRMMKLGAKKGFMGYWEVTTECGKVSIYPGNAGERRRNQYAYFSQQIERINNEHRNGTCFCYPKAK